MNLIAGNPIWTNINKIPNKYHYISEDIECDVVIVGGGVTGALTSYYFSKSGVDTVVIDKNIIGYGSTKGSTSILQYEIDTDLTGLKGIVGTQNAVDCFNETKNAVYEIEKIVKDLDDNCAFRYRDCLYYTDKFNEVNFMRKEYELRKENGFNVRFIDKDNSKDYFSFNLMAGIYSKDLAGDIDPYRFTHSLIRKSVENGTKVYENTEVIDIRNENKGVVLTTTNGFKIKANKVIIATGYEGRRNFKKKSAILTRTFTIVTKPVNEFRNWYNQCIIRDAENAYTYIRTTNDNRIIIGGEDEKVGGERSKMSNLSNEDALSYTKYERLYNKLISLFPDLENIEIEFTFSGLFGETKDGLPYVGEHKDYPNHYFNLGYGSNGIIYGLIGAKLLRDLYFGSNPPILNLFKIDR